MNFVENDNQFCQMCDTFYERFGSTKWLNIIYISLIVCIIIFIFSILFNAPNFMWFVLLVFACIWYSFGYDKSIGLLLLAIFLLFLLILPDKNSGQQSDDKIVITKKKLSN